MCPGSSHHQAPLLCCLHPLALRSFLGKSSHIPWDKGVQGHTAEGWSSQCSLHMAQHGCVWRLEGTQKASPAPLHPMLEKKPPL